MRYIDSKVFEQNTQEKLMSKFPFILVLSLFVFSVSANPTKDKVVGSILKNALESYHYKKMRIDDSVSEKAFEEYLKKVDYGKQFLLSKDVAKLRKFEREMDNQMISGEHQLVEQTQKIMERSIKSVNAYRKKVFKKGFDFTKKESVELDPEKRKWSKSNKEKLACGENF